MRKIVQISNAVCSELGGWLVALCNDGTVWDYSVESREWIQLSDISQSKEAMSKAFVKIDIDRLLDDFLKRHSAGGNS